MMPISSTPTINPLSRGLAKKALAICFCRTKAISPHRIRNTSIRIRKMRGDVSFSGSISLAIGSVYRAESLHNGTSCVTVKSWLCHQASLCRICGGVRAVGVAPLPPSCRRRLFGRLEQAQQFAVHGVVAGHHLTLGQNRVFAVHVAGEP